MILFGMNFQNLIWVKDFIIKFFVLNINDRIKNIEEIKNKKWMNEGKLDFESERELLIMEMEKRKKIKENFLNKYYKNSVLHMKYIWLLKFLSSIN